MTEVAIVRGRERLAITPGHSSDVPTVPAQTLLIEIQGAVHGGRVQLDDEDVPVAPGPTDQTVYVMVDCFRSTGYHRLIVDNEAFWFGTADGKLRLQGIVEIVDFIREEGLSWGKQLLFSDGTAIRNERIDYAWIRSNSNEIVQVCSDIAERPTTTIKREPGIQLPKGKRPIVSKTLSLLRSNSALLEPSAYGLIETNGARWMPRKIVAQKKIVTHDSISNKRATRLLLDVLSLCNRLEQSIQLPNNHKTWVTAFSKQISRFLGLSPFRLLRLKSQRIPSHKTASETNPRSSVVYEFHRSLKEDLGWSPTTKLANRYAYIGYSDEIYQAFVALVLAEAFGATKQSSHLQPNLNSPSFSCDRWSIYYDTSPPSASYKSWRDSSSRPSRLTPDYCFVDQLNNIGLLGDAKYRSTGNGARLQNSALQECQVYMQHFDVPSFVVFFPGPPKYTERIYGKGKEIFVVSIAPQPNIVLWVRESVLPELERLMTPLFTQPV